MIRGFLNRRGVITSQEKINAYCGIPESRTVLTILLPAFLEQSWADTKRLKSSKTVCRIAFDEVFLERKAVLIILYL